IADHFKERSNVITYALTGSGSPRVENLRIVGGKYVFDLFAEGRMIKDLELGMAGKHNVENAIAASTVALRLGVSPDHLQQGLASFRGVARRFQTRVSNEKVVYIDDYAHHPKELDACIASVRELYPGKRITGIFQPHLFTRTRDNVEDFGKSLAQLDELLLLDIYPAREEPIPGVTSDWLLKHVPMDVKECIKKESLLKEIDSRHVEVVLTMGAGDIDSLVAPLERQLNQRYP
ncbi:MAG TPA: cyanophycin synthetase, partial [Flavobacteriales bacterium]|nr:cyanophycin synthetase [Flavobacteriales bacterium]